jgi:cytochrome c-type biogenesis protein CcmH
MKRLLWLLALCVSAWSVNAQTAAMPREAPLMAEDPQLEARMVQLAQELRCLVCQNESLASSHAELADDLRQEVREQLRQGKSDQEIKDYLVARYGDFVLYRPEVKPLTWVLWFGPFALVLLALVLLVRYIAQRRRLYEQLVKEEAAS